MQTRRRATLAGVVAILLWSAFALMTAATAGLPPLQVLALSFAIAGGGGVALLALHGRASLRLLRQSPASWALSVAALFGYHALYFVALKRAPVLEASLVNYLWPLLIVLFAGLMPGERLRAGALIGAVLGLLGTGLLLVRGGSLQLQAEYLVGYTAALAAALTWALYSVLNRRFAEVPSPAIAGSCLAVGVLGAAAHLAFEQWVAPTALQWAVIVLMGVGPIGGAFLLWDRGTKRGDLSLLGTLSYAAPLLSSLWLLLAGAAEPHWSQAVAVALLLLGAYLSLERRR